MPSSAKAEPKADPRILVVEDESRMRELLQRALSSWGCEVAVARSGEEAMRVAAEFAPNVALVDLNLPGMDGLECFQKLRETRPDLQGIVLTGFASIDAARQAIHLDMVDFLTKPCHLGELEQALDRAIRRLAPEPPAIVTEEPAESSPGSQTLEEVERVHILQTLERNRGNRTATATELGISRRTLYYKLTEYQKRGFFSD